MRTLSFLTACLLAVVATPLLAQDAKPDLAKPVPLTDIKGTDLLGPDLVDLDGDGKLDIVAGNYAGNFFFFRNEGTKTAPKFATPKALQTGGKAIKLNHW